MRDLIQKVSRANPLWGALRIYGELLIVDIDVTESTVAKYMIKGQRPPSRTRKTFLQKHAEGIASVDSLVFPTAAFILLYAFVILHHDWGQLVHVAVTAHPIADWIARQISETFP